MIRFASLVKDDRGASIVELAIIAPVLASLLVGLIDISRAYSAKSRFEHAAQRGVQKVQAYQGTSSDYTELKAEVAGAAGVPEASVKIDNWLECNGARQPDYDAICPDGQIYARWLSVEVHGDHVPLFKSRHYPNANEDGTITLHGRASARIQ